MKKKNFKAEAAEPVHVLESTIRIKGVLFKNEMNPKVRADQKFFVRTDGKIFFKHSEFKEPEYYALCLNPKKINIESEEDFDENNYLENAEAIKNADMINSVDQYLSCLTAIDAINAERGIGGIRQFKHGNKKIDFEINGSKYIATNEGILIADISTPIKLEDLESFYDNIESFGNDSFAFPFDIQTISINGIIICIDDIKKTIDFCQKYYE